MRLTVITFMSIDSSAYLTALEAPPVPKRRACRGTQGINCNKDSLKPRTSVLYPVKIGP